MDNVNLIKEIRSAIKRGDLNETKRLIGDDREVLNTMTAFGSWLHVAATKGQLEIVKFLIETGIEIEAKDDTFDASALYTAAGEGHLEIVEYLINQGAKIDVSLAQRNPLFSAIYGGHIDTVKYLVEEGIDISIKYTGENIKNMDAYEYARQFGQTEIAEYLKRQLEEK
ncbi:ankyrin repeat domain-containing protein ['Paenibacillus yunnanensis' Narsing Rao et al. 2020]|uniref:ankyrin repeat domain-containing protein n=1 Tax=Paenibacillus tengchongensis TaxID=2608684 RepID=UPI00124C2AD3|nr:ankyrin repeat domain-containing protein [Paenibacillus tengchongensis]